MQLSFPAVFQQRHPPDSIPTDITLSQYVSIQEKGVSAFEFEGDLECNAFVSARTEIQFFSGECCVQTNLPLPRNQEVYYWEARFDGSLLTVEYIGICILICETPFLFHAGENV